MAAYDYESITVADSAIGLTAAKINPGNGTLPEAVLITFETAQVRYRVDGVAPTSGEGHLGETGDAITVKTQHDIQKFKAIRTGAVSGVIKVTYFNGL